MVEIVILVFKFLALPFVYKKPRGTLANPPADSNQKQLTPKNFMKQHSNAAALLTSFIFCFLLSCGLQAQRPNIIYIMSDDMGYADLSSYGQTKFTTPNLDRLAAEGIKFTNAYAAAPICTPTRVAFM